MEYKGARMTNAAAGMIFGPPVPVTPWRVSDMAERLDAVADELERQNQKWGVQNHPDGTGRNAQPLLGFTADASTAGVLADMVKETCDAAHKDGADTWALILLEEVFEALAEDDPDRLEAELTQVAAVAVQWALAVRRRTDG